MAKALLLRTTNVDKKSLHLKKAEKNKITHSLNWIKQLRKMTAEINKIEYKQNKLSRFDQYNPTPSFEKTNIVDKFLATLIEKIRQKILQNIFGNERSQRTINESDHKNAFKNARKGSSGGSVG